MVKEQLAYTYKSKIWENETWQSILDLYTISLNRSFKEQIRQMSVMGTPKEKDTEKEILPIDQFY